MQSDPVVERDMQEVEEQEGIQADDADTPLQVIQDDGSKAAGGCADADTAVH